jgi:hypothetical protein
MTMPKGAPSPVLGRDRETARKFTSARNILNKRRTLQREARIARLVVLLDEVGGYSPDKAGYLAQRMGLTIRCIHYYLKDLETRNICACCGQMLPPGRVSTNGHAPNYKSQLEKK